MPILPSIPAYLTQSRHRRVVKSSHSPFSWLAHQTHVLAIHTLYPIPLVLGSLTLEIVNSCLFFLRTRLSAALYAKCVFDKKEGRLNPYCAIKTRQLLHEEVDMALLPSCPRQKCRQHDCLNFKLTAAGPPCTKKGVLCSTAAVFLSATLQTSLVRQAGIRCIQSTPR